jgi:hypothetical protein
MDKLVVKLRKNLGIEKTVFEQYAEMANKTKRSKYWIGFPSIEPK